MTDLFEPLPESAGTRRKENTRAKLVRASLDVFVEKGIDGVTVDDLVKAAGFTRGAFYSNFSSKEEVFIALFDEVTAELMAIANSSVESAVADVEADESCSILEADDAQVMLAVFEGIRPFGRQWYLLYSDAIARSLRDETLRAELAGQRERMRNQIGALLATRLAASAERALLPVEDLAQLLMGIFIDLLVREQLEGRDVTQLAATTILGTLRAFIAPKSDRPLRSTAHLPPVSPRHAGTGVGGGAPSGNPSTVTAV
ncbi:TetR/AcrR family transcriptional regulator [Brachybacterium atlanticum]|uniref:TetR/AcrR family transcriptional regulator n=1 Tax=Brachybacterium atlanticum TaxID=2911888 RepID=UPI0021DF99E4|nr:TetR/AcrR family transcriptional regulator [Brachybacterium atlanticum]